MTAPYVTCRVLNRRGNQCTAEAVQADAELLICTRHLAEAMRLVNARSNAKTRRPARG
jgi:hypothetical protein